MLDKAYLLRTHQFQLVNIFVSEKSDYETFCPIGFYQSLSYDYMNKFSIQGKLIKLLEIPESSGLNRTVLQGRAHHYG